ncbi:MerR family transcriptional regulator [Streptomyces flavofungini]|uniref:MerR family transcriptional regulator n=1 Tax=Streptomyces flavofungini TaxID=68200 RepID=A0ABS0XJI6_9ACTN|nr:MerR family transcriptional regulator [Streptomyces flavofungini]MBJ3813096.1 MerR family transcriptional regulator [Streptomyces flavofungini]
MNGKTLYSIGDLAQRTGLTVKAIRFYADTGIVPPTDRTPAGYRRYDCDAIARIDLVRTLRELGIDLATIRKVMEREVSLADVAAMHAEALDVQIRVLRQRRAVLTAVARRGSTPQEMDLMHKLARLSETERQCLIDDFLDAVFDGLHDHPAFAAVTRSLTPELPDDPVPEQIEAWVELAELFQDDGFRTTLHGMAKDLADDRAPSDTTGLPRILAEAVRAQVTPAIEAGVEPDSPEAEPIVTALAAHYAHIVGSPPPSGPCDLYLRLAARLDQMNDPRRDQYLSLLAVINGWPAPESLAPTLVWSAAALRTRVPQR